MGRPPPQMGQWPTNLRYGYHSSFATPAFMAHPTPLGSPAPKPILKGPAHRVPIRWSALWEHRLLASASNEIVKKGFTNSWELERTLITLTTEGGFKALLEGGKIRYLENLGCTEEQIAQLAVSTTNATVDLGKVLRDCYDNKSTLTSVKSFLAEAKRQLQFSTQALEVCALDLRSKTATLEALTRVHENATRFAKHPEAAQRFGFDVELEQATLQLALASEDAELAAVLHESFTRRHDTCINTHGRAEMLYEGAVAQWESTHRNLPLRSLAVQLDIALTTAIADRSAVRRRLAALPEHITYSPTSPSSRAEGMDEEGQLMAPDDDELMSATSEPNSEMILSLRAEEERQAILHEELVLTQQMDGISAHARQLYNTFTAKEKQRLRILRELASTLYFCARETQKVRHEFYLPQAQSLEGRILRAATTLLPRVQVRMVNSPSITALPVGDHHLRSTAARRSSHPQLSPTIVATSPLIEPVPTASARRGKRKGQGTSESAEGEEPSPKRLATEGHSGEERADEAETGDNPPSSLKPASARDAARPPVAQATKDTPSSNATPTQESAAEQPSGSEAMDDSDTSSQPSGRGDGRQKEREDGDEDKKHVDPPTPAQPLTPEEELNKQMAALRKYITERVEGSGDYSNIFWEDCVALAPLLHGMITWDSLSPTIQTRTALRSNHYLRKGAATPADEMNWLQKRARGCAEVLLNQTGSYDFANPADYSTEWQQALALTRAEHSYRQRQQQAVADASAAAAAAPTSAAAKGKTVSKQVAFEEKDEPVPAGTVVMQGPNGTLVHLPGSTKNKRKLGLIMGEGAAAVPVQVQAKRRPAASSPERHSRPAPLTAATSAPYAGFVPPSRSDATGIPPPPNMPAGAGTAQGKFFGKGASQAPSKVLPPITAQQQATLDKVSQPAPPSKKAEAAAAAVQYTQSVGRAESAYLKHITNSGSEASLLGYNAVIRADPSHFSPPKPRVAPSTPAQRKAGDSVDLTAEENEAEEEEAARDQEESDAAGEMESFVASEADGEMTINDDGFDPASASPTPAAIQAAARSAYIKERNGMIALYNETQNATAKSTFKNRIVVLDEKFKEETNARTAAAIAAEEQEGASEASSPPQPIVKVEPKGKKASSKRVTVTQDFLSGDGHSPRDDSISDGRVVKVRYTAVSALKDLPRLDATNPAETNYENFCSQFTETMQLRGVEEDRWLPALKLQLIPHDEARRLVADVVLGVSPVGLLPYYAAINALTKRFGITPEQRRLWMNQLRQIHMGASESAEAFMKRWETGLNKATKGQTNHFTEETVGNFVYCLPEGSPLSSKCSRFAHLAPGEEGRRGTNLIYISNMQELRDAFFMEDRTINDAERSHYIQHAGAQQMAKESSLFNGFDPLAALVERQKNGGGYSRDSGTFRTPRLSGSDTKAITDAVRLAHGHQAAKRLTDLHSLGNNDPIQQQKGNTQPQQTLPRNDKGQWQSDHQKEGKSKDNSRRDRDSNSRKKSRQTKTNNKPPYPSKGSTPSGLGTAVTAPSKPQGDGKAPFVSEDRGTGPCNECGHPDHSLEFCNRNPRPDNKWATDQAKNYWGKPKLYTGEKDEDGKPVLIDKTRFSSRRVKVDRHGQREVITDCLVGKVPFTGAVCDSGSTATLMEHRAYEAHAVTLGPYNRKNAHCTTVEGIDGSEMKVLGVLRTSITFTDPKTQRNYTTPHLIDILIVRGITTDLLIGTDVICGENGIKQIDFHTGELSFGVNMKERAFTPIVPHPARYSVRLSKAIRLAPGETRPVPLHFEAPSRTSNATSVLLGNLRLTGTDGQGFNLSVPEAIHELGCARGDRAFVATVTNPFQQFVRLREGLAIAYAEPIGDARIARLDYVGRPTMVIMNHTPYKKGEARPTPRHLKNPGDRSRWLQQMTDNFVSLLEAGFAEHGVSHAQAPTHPHPAGSSENPIQFRADGNESAEGQQA
jgi:hypothetical protein